VGATEQTVSVTPSGTGLTLSYVVRFRVGRVGNLGARWLTGYWAPDAWMGVKYTIESNGNVEVAFSGSHIPSQQYYVDWVAAGARDMLQSNAAEIDGFLQAGAGVKGPGAQIVVWQGQGRWC
jgi:hypothetical protein